MVANLATSETPAGKSAGGRKNAKGERKMINQNGMTTTTENGQFQCEGFNTKLRGKNVRRYQWDYRDSSGKLHSGVAKTEDEAKQKAVQFGYIG